MLLLHKGLQLADIMFVQALFSVAVFLCEFPSGVLADLYDRRVLYEISIVVWIVACLTIYWGQGFIPMAIAWVLYGISEALSSGTIDASLINLCKVRSTDPVEQVKRFKRISNQLSLIAMVVGASLGSVLYFRIGFNMYLVGVAFAVLSVLPIIFFFPHDNQSEQHSNRTIRQQIETALAEVKSYRSLLLLIALTAVSQIFFGTHFNLWQAYMLSIGMSENNLIYWYFLFQAIGIIACSIRIDQHLRRVMLLATPCAMAFPLFILFPDRIVGVCAYCLATFTFMFLQYMYDVLFSLRVSQERISTLITLNSTASRLAGFLVLGANGLLLNTVNLRYLIVIDFEISLVLSVVLCCLFLRSKHKREEGSSGIKQITSSA